MADAADSKSPQPSSDSVTYENHESDVAYRRPSSEAPGQSWGKDGGPAGAVPSPPDVVEAALAEALTKASAAGQWTTVEVLSRELTARREARAGVVELDAKRGKRRGRP
jgi:hypothetical protein